MDGSEAAIVNTFDPQEHRLETKRCRRCGVLKVLWAFYRQQGRRDGHRPECKRCHARWRRSRYQPKTGRRYQTRADKLAAAQTCGAVVPESQGEIDVQAKE